MIALILLLFSINTFAQKLTTIFVEENKVQVSTEKSAYFHDKGEEDTAVNREQNFILKEIDYNSSVHTSKSGGYGGTTSIFMRGMPSHSTSVYFGDIKISDPSAFNRTADPSFIDSSFISSVDVLKGGQGVLYGSDSTAGVIKLNPKKPMRNGSEVKLSFGNFDTRKTLVKTSKVKKNYAYTFGASNFITSGFSSVGNLRNSESDSASNTSFYLSHFWSLSPRIDNEFLFYSTNSEFEQDNFFSPNTNIDDENYRGRKLETMASNSISISTRKENQVRIKAQYYQVMRRDIDEVDSFTFVHQDDVFRGENLNIEIQDIVQVDKYKGLFAISHYQERADMNASWIELNKNAIQNSFYTNHELSLDQVQLEAGARISKHEIFGTNESITLGGKTKLLDRVSLITRYGEGFKNPTLFQFFNTSSGSRELKAEQSRSYDMGFELTEGLKLKAQIIYFQQRLTNRIGTNPNTKTFFQGGSTVSSEGLEASVKYEQNRQLNLSAAYTNTDTKNSDFSKVLKIPRDKFAATVQYKLTDRFSSFYRTKLISKVYDYGELLINSYALSDVGIKYSANKNVSYDFSIENVFNRKYATSFGYNAFPLMLQFGTRLTF